MLKAPFIRLIRREASIPLSRPTWAAAVAALANVLALAIAISVAQQLSQGRSGTGGGSSGIGGISRISDGISRIGDGISGLDEGLSGLGAASPGGFSSFLLYLVVIILSIFASRYMIFTTSQIVEDAVHKIRVRIARKIAACELAAFEKIGRGAVYSCLSRDTEVLSDMSIHVIYGTQMGLLGIFICIYLVFVSLLAFVLVVAFMLAAAFILMGQRKALIRDMGAAAASGNKLLEIITHLLDGFKEVKLNNRRRDHLLSEVDNVSGSAHGSKMAARTTLASYSIFSSMSFYVLLGVTMFLLPVLSSSFSQNVVQVSTAVLFIMGPVLGVAGALASFESVNQSSKNLEEMEKVLDDAVSSSTERVAGAVLALESLGLQDLEFDYLDAEGAPLFSMGPLGLGVAAGETVFFIGGNGSGKSTLLKLLTALYEPRSGALLANGSPVLDENRQSFREQIATVFSDYHLFNRLYGLEHVDDVRANQMIDHLGLGGKTRVKDGRFETLELSGGQRKRLGFLVALLEDRPVLVLDEVAADQDPEFRRRFYHELLPELQREGKTLLLASHDDRYFRAADRLVVLDEGKIREIVEPEKT